MQLPLKSTGAKAKRQINTNEVDELLSFMAN